MRAPSVKSQFGPTLPELVGPRWRTAPPGLRLLIGAAVVVVVVAAAVGWIRHPRNTSFSYRGTAVAFNFNYPRPLRQVKRPAAADVRIEARSRSGRLLEWFEVDPLKLGPYAGEISGQFPIYATTYIAGLARRVPGFEIQTETKTRINLTAGYSITYSGEIEGHLMYGRVVLLVSALTGVRDGVILTMGIQPSPSLDASPDQVGSADVLEKPLRTFRLGA